MRVKEKNGSEQYFFSPRETYRMILGLSVNGGIPRREELPDYLQFPNELVKDIVPSLRQTVDDGKVRSGCVYWHDDEFQYENVDVGSKKTASNRYHWKHTLQVFLGPKPVLMWEVYPESKSFNAGNILTFLSLPRLAYMFLIGYPGDMSILVQTDESARLPITHHTPVLRAMLEEGISILSKGHSIDYSLAAYADRKGFGLYQLQRKPNIADPMETMKTLEFKRVT